MSAEQGVGTTDTLDGEVTREQIMEALRELREDLDAFGKKLDAALDAHAELVRRTEALERRVARQEQRRAAEARGGVR